MAVTAATPANLVVGAGDIYRNAAAWGATTDDNVFRVEQDYFVPQLNGVKGALVGTDYLTREEGFMEFTVAEISAATMSAAWPSSSSTGSTTVTIDSDDTRRIPTAAYGDYELRVPGLDGKQFSFFVDDAIATTNAETTAGDDSLMAPRLTVRGSWDPADLTASPHRIVISGITT